MEFPEVLHKEKALTSIFKDEYSNIYVKTGMFSFTVVERVSSRHFNYEPLGTWIALDDFLKPELIEQIKWPEPVLCRFEVVSKNVLITSIDTNQECSIKYVYEDGNEKMIIENNFFSNPQKDFKEQLLSWD